MDARGIATEESRGTPLHPDVIKLGLVSLLTDLSSEMIFSVFAVFLTTIAGASTVLLGLVEGLADLSSCSLDYFAGWLSDRTGRRKPLALLGYGFSSLAKSILLVSSAVLALSVFRIIERLGKSFRGPPRDAWLASVAEQSIRGYSFGVHKALDKSGAVLGPLVAYGILTVLGETAATYRVVFRVAFVPALIAVLLLLVLGERAGERHERERLLVAWKTLSRGFKRYLVAAGLFSLAYFSFGFLLLRAHDVGFSLKDTVLLYALFNAAFVIAAPLVGRVGDKIGRTRIVLLGYVSYLVMSLGFAVATVKWEVSALFVLYGIFYSIDEAQSRAFIADVEPERRATAIGVYNFVTGGIYLLASSLAGVLWQLGPQVVFMLAALMAAMAALALVWLRPADC